MCHSRGTRERGPKIGLPTALQLSCQAPQASSVSSTVRAYYVVLARRTHLSRGWPTRADPRERARGRHDARAERRALNADMLAHNVRARATCAQSLQESE